MKPIEETHPSVVQYGLNHIRSEQGFALGWIADLNWEDFTQLIQATTIDKQVLVKALHNASMGKWTNKDAVEQIKEELGLEDEEMSSEPLPELQEWDSLQDYKPVRYESIEALEQAIVQRLKQAQFDSLEESRIIDELIKDLERGE